MYLAFEGCDSRSFIKKCFKFQNSNIPVCQSEYITFYFIHIYCFPWKCEARFCVKFSSVCGDKFHYWEELSHRFNKIAHLLCPGNLQCALIILKRYPTKWDSQMHIFNSSSSSACYYRFREAPLGRHCRRQNGLKALSALTHPTPLVPSRGFKKFWNLGLQLGFV